jgi:hypothetical protein
MPLRRARSLWLVVVALRGIACWRATSTPRLRQSAATPHAETQSAHQAAQGARCPAHSRCSAMLRTCDLVVPLVFLGDVVLCKPLIRPYGVRPDNEGLMDDRARSRTFSCGVGRRPSVHRIHAACGDWRRPVTSTPQPCCPAACKAKRVLASSSRRAQTRPVSDRHPE